jgi:hypothetical protein
MIVVGLSGEALTFFRDAAKAFPKEVRSAFGVVANTIARQMRKAMRVGGGVYGVPSFAPHNVLSTFLRGPRPIGGKLTLPHMIQAYKPKQDMQMIGFLTDLDPYARAFQTSSVRPFTKEERRMFYRRGIRGKQEEYAGVKFNVRSAELASMRAGYNRPGRPVIDPVVANANPMLSKWLKGALRSALLRGKQYKVAA